MKVLKLEERERWLYGIMKVREFGREREVVRDNEGISVCYSLEERWELAL